MQIIVSQRAHQHLSDIWEYSCAQWGEAVANDYFKDMEETLATLAEFPSLLKKREYSSIVQYFPSRRHVFFFIVTTESLYLVGVYHGAMQLESLLAEIETYAPEEMNRLVLEIQAKTPQ